MRQRGYIVSAFPASGKSHAVEVFRQRLDRTREAPRGTIVDLDTQQYCDRADFHRAYVNAIRDGYANHQQMFVSSHRKLIPRYLKVGLPVLLAYPDRRDKDQYLDRLIARGDSLDMMSYLYHRWDELLNACEAFHHPDVLHVVLRRGDYLSDALTYCGHGITVKREYYNGLHRALENRDWKCVS